MLVLGVPLTSLANGSGGRTAIYLPDLSLNPSPEGLTSSVYLKVSADFAGLCRVVQHGYGEVKWKMKAMVVFLFCKECGTEILRTILDFLIRGFPDLNQPLHFFRRSEHSLSGSRAPSARIFSSASTAMLPAIIDSETS